MALYPLVSALTLVAIAVGVGALLAIWKECSLETYAVGEVVFGLMVSFATLWHLPPDFELAKILTVGSAVYVMSRGFGNIRSASC